MTERNLERMEQAVAEIRRKMADAAREAGRDPAGVQLCAACKTHTPQTIALSARLPIDLFGENHVQELCANSDAGAYCAALEKEASKMDIVQDILLEVNIGEEASKTGVSPEELWALLDLAAAQPHLRVKGLMAIPPVNEDDAQNRALLGQVYKLFVRAGERGYDNVRMEILSMGMSGDFENAIREGATLVRIGTAIYGARDYGPKA